MTAKKRTTPPATTPGDTPFLSDVTMLRAQARKHMDQGPVTASYGADLPRVLDVLNTSLATELVCVLRYKAHYFGAKGLDAEPIAEQFLEHAGEEQVHADQISERINQLGGTPDLNPNTLMSRSHTEYNTPDALRDMITEDLVAERVVIAAYTEIITWLGHDDPTTRRMFEQILAEEEEHADDMLTLLQAST